MSAVAKITPEERANIIAVLTETENVSETARRTGRAKGTVSKIASDEGLNVVARSRTKRATSARKVDAAEQRAILAARWRQRELRLLDRLDAIDDGGTYRLVHPVPSGDVIQRDVTGCPAKDYQVLHVAAGVASDKARLLELADGGDDAGARGLLERVVAGLEAVAS